MRRGRVAPSARPGEGSALTVEAVIPHPVRFADSTSPLGRGVRRASPLWRRGLLSAPPCPISCSNCSPRKFPRACSAAQDLRKLVTDALVERGFVYEAAVAYATPRRLALHVVGLPAKGKDVREERKGPRVGAPEKAVEGFLKSAGLSSLAEARIEEDPKKGAFYVAAIERPGRPTPEALAEILPAIVRGFPWPKSMRWGAASAEPGSLRWVRPLHAIVCTFGPETEAPEVVPFAVDGIRSGDLTQGHRFMAPAPIQVRRFADYAAALERAKVVLDQDRRKDVIRAEAQNLAFASGLALVEDEALLEEVAGLVEWPVVLMGV